MNYSFTEEVREALQQARKEALAQHVDYVGPEHIAVALTRFPTVISILEKLGLEPEVVRRAVLAPHRPGTSKARGELPYTSLAKKSLERAMTEARNQNSEGVEADAVLIGVLEA